MINLKTNIKKKNALNAGVKINLEKCKIGLKDSFKVSFGKLTTSICKTCNRILQGKQMVIHTPTLK